MKNKRLLFKRGALLCLDQMMAGGKAVLSKNFITLQPDN